ncbi:hypothetical protein RVS70_05335 [Virgibacillus sp. M23]|uniref:ATP-dependent DNA ligase n=1 Tax=Virgibacillus sp. M23 TaxID=3079030 RepID=UPI002A917E68|nr:hypothetical protein [Virgibacillus sp. M23]MDY7043624.1 hypothetical protein [Virgibacillus sp. M23]
MLGVNRVINDIMNTTKKKEKEEILKKNINNELLKEILYFIYNPYIKTNIAKKKLRKDVTLDSRFAKLNSVQEYMKFLKSSTGKDEHIAVVQNYINSQPEELRHLLEGMATKDLKIGATSTTINKAFGKNFIPTFDLMLADKYVDIKRNGKVVNNWEKYKEKRVIATKKLDGNRVVVFVKDNGKVELYSREGHKLEGYVEIEEAFTVFPKGQAYDGELLAINDEGLNSRDLFTKTSRIVKKKGLKTGVEFWAFDILPIKEFKKGGFEIHCERRKEMLSLVVAKANSPLVHYVEPLYVGQFDKEEIDKLARQAKSNEEEGIMVQLALAPYQCKRTKDILKVKAFESADIKCIDVYEGKSGKNLGRLGGLVLDYKGYPVNVGGGFSDEERIAYWDNKNLVLNKIIEITYFEEFENDEGVLDLRFAQFKTIRHDKTEPSYY